MKQNQSILTVGSLAFDTIESPEGKAEGVVGGSVNYFSIAASFFSPVQIVGVVGKDFPKTHLAKQGADRKLLESSPKEFDKVLRQAVVSGCVMASFTVEDFSVHRLMRLESGELDLRENLFKRMISPSAY